MAFPMDLKVVKVGDIDALPEEQSILLPDNSTPERNEINPSNWRPMSQLSSCSGRWNSYQNDPPLLEPIKEEVDLPQKGGAPDNWPRIPQLSRRRSCEASWNRTNCVKKAVEHLKLLLDIFTDCVQEVPEKEVPEKEVPEKGISEKEVPRESNADRTVSIFDLKPKNEEHELVPLKLDGAVKAYKSHSQLKEVVNEVMLLLAWLQDDCQRTETRLDSERALCLQLSKEMDEMSQQKLIDVRAAVEKGIELYKKRLYCSTKQNKGMHLLSVHCRRKIKVQEHLRYCLTKDITIKKEQIPLLQTKMTQQNEQTNKIINDINEVNMLLVENEDQKKEIKVMYKEAVRLAGIEQHKLDQALNAVSHEFNLISAAAKSVEEEYHKMVKGIDDAKQQIEENSREMTILKVKLENRRTRSNSLRLQRKGEKDILMKNACKNKREKGELKKLESEIRGAKCELDGRMKELEEQGALLEKEFNSLLKTNNNQNDIIQHMRTRMDTSQKQRTFFEENRKRLSYEMMKMEAQVTFAYEKLRDMEEKQRLLKESIEEEHEKISEEEKTMLKIIHRLQNELANEEDVSVLSMERVGQMKLELKSAQSEAAEEKDSHYIKLSNWMKTLNDLKDKMRRLQSLKEETEAKLRNLEHKRTEIKGAFEQLHHENEMYLNSLGAYPSQCQEKGREMEMKIVEMSYEEDRMRDELEHMNEQRPILKEDLIELQQNIEEMIEVVRGLDLQYDAVSNRLSNTKDRLKQVQGRVSTEQREHRDLMNCRRETLREIRQKKEQSLKENERFSSKYRRAQMALCQKKEEYVQLSDVTMRLRRKLKNFKQEMSAHSKIHDSNQRYSEYRGLYHREQLAYFVISSAGSKSKLKQLDYEHKATLRKLGTALDAFISSHLKKRGYFLPMITHPVP